MRDSHEDTKALRKADEAKVTQSESSLRGFVASCEPLLSFDLQTFISSIHNS